MSGPRVESSIETKMQLIGKELRKRDLRLEIIPIEDVKGKPVWQVLCWPVDHDNADLGGQENQSADLETGIKGVLKQWDEHLEWLRAGGCGCAGHGGGLGAALASLGKDST